MARSRLSTAKRKSGTGSGVKDNARRPWTPIAATKENLLEQMLSMYWKGVTREVKYIILTLKDWQKQSLASVVLGEEKDYFVHGFDTFIDQVSETSRQFATEYGMEYFSSYLHYDRTYTLFSCTASPKRAPHGL
jgi:hypothetical protein